MPALPVQAHIPKVGSIKIRGVAVTKREPWPRPGLARLSLPATLIMTRTKRDTSDTARIKKGSSGISGKRRMDRGGTDRQSTTLMKTRTTRDTTDKAPIKKVLPEFPGNAARKGQRKQTNDCEAGGTGRVLGSRRRGQSRTQRAQPG